MTYELRRQKSGALAVYDPVTGETMHPVHGPWAEANRLYIAATRLLERITVPPAGPFGDVCVFDVGLGGAANALAAVTCHQNILRQGRFVRPLRIVSFEHDPETLRFVLDNAAALGYPLGYEGVLQALLAEGAANLPGGLTWELRLGDFPTLVAEEPARADVVFFDPYSPRTNPDMWQVATLETLHGCRRPGGQTVLATYSSAFGVRAALLLAGFFVGEGPRLSPQRRSTVAATDFRDLSEPLAPTWLARWRRDAEPWPPGTPPGQRPQVRAALLEHPQWSDFGSSAGAAAHSPGPARARQGGRNRRRPRR